MERRELVVIGAGPAGLSAAIYGRRAGLDVLLLETGLAGGQINSTDEIENWPGVISSTGMALGAALREHAEHFKAELRDCRVQKIEIRDGVKTVATNKGETEAQAVIIATGASFRKLGCKGEAEFTGAGVSYCAVCDGAFFEGSTIAVVGGGNTAVEEAVYLTRFAEKVYVVHRRDEWRAAKSAVEQAMSNKKIVPVWDSVVEAIEGDGLVERLVIRNVKTNKTSELPVSGCFIFVGTSPNVEFLKEGNLPIKQSKGGWILTNDQMETSVEGIFAAGDVREKYLRQAITAASDGAVAAVAANSYITEQLRLSSALLEPERVTALFTSSVEEEQIALARSVENYAKEHSLKIELADGYRNKRMLLKLGVEALPELVELEKGKVVRRARVSSLEDAAAFMK